ncbi:hypothetical protein N0O92_10505 [Alkalihalobacillus sp. MEB130]|uniref:hypothetical protein n=1 Tax=Alkalihalobacillus sp. MEB130 TaxID=2976704 RepID=UPI0028E09695|nr:hypothetical protein [Alkalihalobacillus sp. MEB130]MDT8860664.1 hypothetical protein [Alkalihalobacillus sp. MEB130]
MLKRTYNIKNGEVKQAIEKSGMELREFATLSLEKLNVKSKKKRIRQKALKRVFAQNEVVKEILLMVDSTNEKNQEQESSKVKKQVAREESVVSVRGLPVTFLLKLGKAHMKDLDVVKYYYNAEKEEFYKNKKLLENAIEEEAKNLDSEPLLAFQEEVQAELDKRAKK